VAAIEFEWAFKIIKPFVRRLISAVRDPTMRLQKRRWAQKFISSVFVAIPPVAGARGGAAETENAAVQPF
jgi:hypothetical protein